MFSIGQNRENDMFVADLLRRATDAGPSGFVFDHARFADALAGCQDSSLVANGISLLFEKARHSALDEPTLEKNHPGELAAKLAESLSSKAETPAIRAQLLHLAANGMRFAGPPFFAESQRLFEAAFDIWKNDPPNEAVFDYAILHKWKRDFSSLLASMQKLGGLEGSRGVVWNLAIAASALGQGELATSAWKSLGFEAQLEGALPVVDGMPAHFTLRVPTKPRLYQFGKGYVFETVSVAPISPCHGVVQSPVFGEAPCRYGDMVIWDGDPVARLNKQPVFALLDVIHRAASEDIHWIAKSEASAKAMTETLAQVGPVYLASPKMTNAAGFQATERNFQRGSAIRSELGLGVSIVTKDECLKLHDAFEELRQQGHRFAVPKLYELLEDTARAGREHKRWGQLERHEIA